MSSSEPQVPHHVMMQWTRILTPRKEQKKRGKIKPTGASM
jgi:hypothetical protein